MCVSLAHRSIGCVSVCVCGRVDVCLYVRVCIHLCLSCSQVHRVCMCVCVCVCVWGARAGVSLCTRVYPCVSLLLTGPFVSFPILSPSIFLFTPYLSLCLCGCGVFDWAPGERAAAVKLNTHRLQIMYSEPSTGCFSRLLHVRVTLSHSLVVYLACCMPCYCEPFSGCLSRLLHIRVSLSLSLVVCLACCMSVLL
jgi:hypothetical protein